MIKTNDVLMTCFQNATWKLLQFIITNQYDGKLQLISLRNYWLIEEGWYDQLVPFITILDISWYKLKTLLRKAKYEVILLHRETIHFALGYKLLKLTNINLCFNKSLLKMCMCRNAFQKCGKFRIFFSGVKRISHNSEKYWNLLFRQNGKLHFLCK